MSMILVDILCETAVFKTVFVECFLHKVQPVSLQFITKNLFIHD